MSFSRFHFVRCCSTGQFSIPENCCIVINCCYKLIYLLFVGHSISALPCSSIIICFNHSLTCPAHGFIAHSSSLIRSVSIGNIWYDTGNCDWISIINNLLRDRRKTFFVDILLNYTKQMVIDWWLMALSSNNFLALVTPEKWDIFTGFLLFNCSSVNIEQMRVHLHQLNGILWVMWKICWSVSEHFSLLRKVQWNIYWII